MGHETGQRAAVTRSEETQTYFAVSIFKTKAFWVNTTLIVLELLNSLTPVELYNALGIQFEQRAILIMVCNIILRRFSERPARVMRPGDTIPVEVKKL